jgi:hypothetical protein
LISKPDQVLADARISGNLAAGPIDPLRIDRAGGMRWSMGIPLIAALVDEIERLPAEGK